MNRCMLTFISLFAGLVFNGQGNTLIVQNENTQLNDLRNGVLLIPLENEPESSGFGLVGNINPVDQEILETNRARIQAFSQNYNVSKIGYFFLDDKDSVLAMNFEGAVFDSLRNPLSIFKFSKKNIFIAEFKPRSDSLPLEILVFNKKKNRYKTKKPQSKKTASFNTEIDKYSDTSTNSGVVIVRRITPTVYETRKKKYFFNFNYTVRLHLSLSTYARYRQVAEQLEFRLKES